MAYEKLDLLERRTQDPYPRIQPDDAPGSLETRTFAEAVGAPEYPVGTPLVHDDTVGNGGMLRPWVDADANSPAIVAIVYPRAVQTHATNETLGVAMFRGRAHVDDIVAASGETEATLKTALSQPGLRLQGLFIDGLVKKL